MQNSILKYAEVINEAYDLESTYDPTVQYDVLFILGGDAGIVKPAKDIYYALQAKNPKMLLAFVGGKDLQTQMYAPMSISLKLRSLTSHSSRRCLAKLFKETGAERLNRVGLEIGYSSMSSINITTDSLQQQIRGMSILASRKKALVVVLQREAMLFKQSAEYQCNQYAADFGCFPFNFDTYVIHQTVSECQHWYNLLRAKDGLLLWEYFSGLVRCFDLEDGKTLTKPFEPNPFVREAADSLEKAFHISKKTGKVKKCWAFWKHILLKWEIFVHAKDYVASERKLIHSY